MATQKPARRHTLPLLFLHRYVLRLPLSGEQLIDGKGFADAIRSNVANPDCYGRCGPSHLS